MAKGSRAQVRKCRSLDKLESRYIYTRPPHVQAPTCFIFLFGIRKFLPCLHQRFYLCFFPRYYVMASLFSKRLTCFYCGQRSARSHHGPVCNFRCEHCEADNFFDEVGSLRNLFTGIYSDYANDCLPKRKEKLQTHQLWSPTPTRLAHQTHPSNRLTSVDHSYFAPNVLGISIYLPAP